MPEWLISLHLRMKALVKRSELDRDVADELEFHAAMMAEKRGLSKSETARAFGNRTAFEEKCRDAWTFAAVEALFLDLCHAWRALARSKAFALLAVFLLALGMGASTAMFSLLDAVLLKSLSVKDPERLVLLTDPQASGVSVGTDYDVPRTMLSYAEFMTLRSRMRSFSDMFAVESQYRRLNATIDGGAPEEVRFRLVSGDYFTGMGVAPLLGRAFTVADEKGPGSAPVAVISYNYWRDRFGLAADVWNRRLQVFGTSYRIVGVMPAGFAGENVGNAVQAWVPLVMQPQIRLGEFWLADDPAKFDRVMWLQVFGRLRNGVDLRQAQSEADVVWRQMTTATFSRFLASQPRILNQSLKLRPGVRGTSTLRAQFAQPLYLLLAIAGVLLLTACTNIAGLLLARAAARQKEVAMRMALGAGRLRLIRQFIAESLLVSLAAAVAGGVLAMFAIRAIMVLASDPTDLISLNVQPDWRVFAFSAGAVSVATLIFGLTPALLSTRADLHQVVKGTARNLLGGGASAGTGRLVVAAQVALSAVLLMAAGWFALTLRNLEHLDLGYSWDRLLEIRVDPLTAGYHRQQLASLYTDLQGRFLQLPGVRAVTFSDNGLFSGHNSSDVISVEGYTGLPGQETSSRFDQVGPAYFSSVGIPILEGREIGPQDQAGAKRVCVINRAFANKFFPGRDPIGRHISFNSPDLHAPIEIVGVALDARDHKLRENAEPLIYLAELQPLGDGALSASMNYEIRTVANPASLIEPVRKQVADTNPNMRIMFNRPLGDLLANQTLSDRLLARLALVAGGLALLITCFGLYAVLSFSVARRTREIGVRLALGARPEQIIHRTVRESVAIVLAGLALGVPLALAASTLVRSSLFGLSAADPATIAFVIASLTMASVISAVVPALRAATIDPMSALRCQ
jgi:putative ABC transport system permease protein